MELDLFHFLARHMKEGRLERFLETVEHRTRHISFVVEDLFQPHNASAVLRSCDCFGIQDVHIIEKRNRYTTDDKIALGAGKWVETFTYRDEKDATLTCLNTLKKKGYKIVATTPHKDDFTPATIPLDQPLAVVFGKEMEGISETVINEADYFMKIPMYGFTESLNISVAAAITAQNLYTRLVNSEIEWKLSSEEKQEIVFQWMQKSIKGSHGIIDRYYKTIADSSGSIT